ncbi:MAG: ADP-ribosylglycohydrolase family protein, partial [Planctomycetia bacterium]
MNPRDRSLPSDDDDQPWLFPRDEEAASEDGPAAPPPDRRDENLRTPSRDVDPLAKTAVGFRIPMEVFDATGDTALGVDFETDPASPHPSDSHRQPVEAVGDPRTARRSRFAGAVLGGAIGDAMGHPTEFIGSVASIKDRYGPNGVERFELYWERDGKRFAPYTDDTQMAEIVLRSILDEPTDLDAAMRRMAAGFVEWSQRPQGGHRAPGNAC